MLVTWLMNHESYVEIRTLKWWWHSDALFSAYTTSTLTNQKIPNTSNISAFKQQKQKTAETEEKNLCIPSVNKFSMYPFSIVCEFRWCATWNSNIIIKFYFLLLHFYFKEEKKVLKQKNIAVTMMKSGRMTMPTTMA